MDWAAAAMLVNAVLLVGAQFQLREAMAMSSALDLTGPFPTPPEHYIGQRTDTACIDWPGTPGPQGYGQTKWLGRTYGAHVMAWVKAYGPIPAVVPRLMVLHTCDRRICVNPEHLWLGTNSDNAADRDAKDRGAHVLRTHCRHGHPYDEANTGYYRGARYCRACKAAAAARARAPKTAVIADLFGG